MYCVMSDISWKNHENPFALGDVADKKDSENTKHSEIQGVKANIPKTFQIAIRTSLSWKFHKAPLIGTS